jgi:predicted dehydrogenase
MDKRFSAALVGCGRIGVGDNFHRVVRPCSLAEALERNRRIELAALVDTDNSRLALAGKNYPCAELFSSIGEMMKKISPEIVVLATPTDQHCPNLLEILKFGSPVILCEKPIAPDSVTALQMIRASKKRKSPLFVHHQRHFDSLNRKWADLVKSGIIGKVYQGSAYYSNGLMNNGTHLLNLLMMFLGDVAWVIGSFNKETLDDSVDSNVDGLIFFKSGALLSLHSLSKNYGVFDFEIFGEKGSLIVRSFGASRIEFRKKINNKIYRGYFDLSRPKREGKIRSALVGTIQYLVSYLESRVPAISTGEDGLVVLRVLEALKKSASSNGKKLFLD